MAKSSQRENKYFKLQASQKVAKDDYGIKAKTIELGYGYNNPCYVITSDVSQILLDYDSYQRVYQRGVKYDG